MGKDRVDEIKALGKEQLGRLERMGTGSAGVHVAQALAPDEAVHALYGAQIDGKGAIIALTDRRILAGYGFLPRTTSIDYKAINQVESGLTSVKIQGSGVELQAKSVARKDDLLAAIQDRRQAAHASPIAASASAAPDPTDQLAKLAELHAAGVLTDEEFAAKKAEILARI